MRLLMTDVSLLTADSISIRRNLIKIEINERVFVVFVNTEGVFVYFRARNHVARRWKSRGKVEEIAWKSCENRVEKFRKSRGETQEII